MFASEVESNGDGVRGHFSSSLAALSDCSLVRLSIGALVYLCVGTVLVSLQSCHCDNC